VHDVEDAVVGGRLELDRLDSAEERAAVVQSVLAWYGPGVEPAALEEALNRLRQGEHWVRGYDGSRAALAALKDLTSQLIGRFCGAAEAATRQRFGPGPLTRYGATLVVPEGTVAEILVL